MTILITGAHGQLGQALQSVLAESHESFLPFGREELDITDERRTREAVASERPHLIVNAAAYNAVDHAESDPAAAFAGNETGPRNLALAARAIDVPIVHVSTDYVFDGKKKHPYLESDSVNPLSIYGKSKLAGENAVREATPLHFVVRTAWVFHTRGKNFFRSMLALSEKGPVNVVNDQFSSPTYAMQLARAILSVARTHDFGLFHMAGNGSASRYEQLLEFYRCLGRSYEVNPVSKANFRQAAPRPVFSALATERIVPFVMAPWEEGVRECAEVWS